jgi:hypothetical protein
LHIALLNAENQGVPAATCRQFYGIHIAGAQSEPAPFCFQGNFKFNAVAVSNFHVQFHHGDFQTQFIESRSIETLGNGFGGCCQSSPGSDQ